MSDLLEDCYICINDKELICKVTEIKGDSKNSTLLFYDIKSNKKFEYLFKDIGIPALIEKIRPLKHWQDNFPEYFL